MGGGGAGKMGLNDPPSPHPQTFSLPPEVNKTLKLMTRYGRTQNWTNMAMVRLQGPFLLAEQCELWDPLAKSVADCWCCSAAFNTSIQLALVHVKYFTKMVQSHL